MPQESILIESDKDNPESEELGMNKKKVVIPLSDVNAPTVAPLTIGMSVIM